MRGLFLLLVFSGSLILAACGGNGDATGPSMHDSSIAAPLPSGNYIVVLKSGEAPTAVTALTAQLATPPKFVYNTALVGFAGVLRRILILWS